MKPGIMMTTLAVGLLSLLGTGAIWPALAHASSHEDFAITGSVVCTTCEPDEVRNLHPEATALYPVIHPQGQFVFKVDDVTGLSLWRTLSLPSHVTIRLGDQLFRTLTATENRYKRLKLNARLNNGSVIDILHVQAFQQP
jgi:hypothetical protein